MAPLLSAVAANGSDSERGAEVDGASTGNRAIRPTARGRVLLREITGPSLAAARQFVLGRKASCGRCVICHIPRAALSQENKSPPTGVHDPENLIFDTQGGRQRHPARCTLHAAPPLPHPLRVGNFRAVANMVCPDRMQTLRHSPPGEKGLQQPSTSKSLCAGFSFLVMLLSQVKCSVYIPGL